MGPVIIAEEEDFVEDPVAPHLKLGAGAVDQVEQAAKTGVIWSAYLYHFA